MAGLVFVTLGLSWLLCCCTQAQPPPLDAICDSNGRCTWHGSGWYRGCVSDIPVLTFNQFNDGGLLDLRCSEVQVLSIESSTLTCADMKAHVITHTAVTIYLGESQTECVRLVTVSISFCNNVAGGGGYSISFLCGNYNKDDRGWLIPNNNFTAHLTTLTWDIKDPSSDFRPTDHRE